jgi:hypothetical protein
MRYDSDWNDLLDGNRGETDKSMRGLLLPVCVAAIALTGCGRALHSVAAMAESTRTATEHMASASAASSASREVEVYPGAAGLRGTPPLKLSARYETREGPDGFMVYDTENHTIARIGNQSQAGLSMDQAQKAAEALSWADQHQESIGQLK